MVIEIISEDKHSKQYYKKKTNSFFNINNGEWVDRIYLYIGDVLLRLFDGGVSLNSLNDTDAVYSLVCGYIEFLFNNTQISVFGTYDIDRLSRVEGVRILEI